MATPLKPNQIVGRTVNKIRTRKKITQEALAERVGIDRQSLQRIEAGKWNMTINYLDRLRRGLEVTWKEIFLDLRS